MCVLRKSAQTGFVHQADGIPIYENLCFILSLFRSHTAVQFKEGTELLKRVLEFFNGGFPFHLHDYPTWASPSYQLRCAMPIYWMLKLYISILDMTLKQDLSATYQMLIRQASEALSPLYQVVLSALLEQKDILPYQPHFSHEWGLLLASYQIADEKPAWILEGALAHWDAQLMTYSGPAFQEYQRKNQPEVTLYDLFMAQYQEKELSRFNPLLSMQRSLVFPYKVRRNAITPLTLQTARHHEKWNLKGFHSMRLLWGSHHNVRSLVCQHPLFLTKEKEWLLFEYPKDIPHEKERLELAFFMSCGEDVHILVEGKRQIVFHLGETIAIHTPEKTVKLCFSIKKGEGKLMGHISRGNRPAQIGIEGKEDFASYDWKMGLRSIERSSDLTVGMRVF